MIDFKKQIARELNDPAFGLTDEEVEGMIEIPADTSHGDYAFPCFKLARTLRKAPPLIAADVAERIAGSPFFEKVEQVNAYVNMFLRREQWPDRCFRSPEGKRQIWSLRCGSWKDSNR